MEKTIELWAKTYYTNLLWYVSMLIAVIAGIKYYRKERTYLFFLTYATSGLVIFLGLDILRYELYFQGRRNSLLLETCNILFAIIETTAFNMFFYKVNFKFHKLIITAYLVLFYILSVIFFIKIIDPEFSKSQITSFSFQITVIEFFQLLFLTLIYFYQLFTGEPVMVKPLNKTPSFWITTGLFFYIVVSLPFLLIGYKLFYYDHSLYYLISSIHFISIIFLFLCLAKAFSCKTTLTT